VLHDPSLGELLAGNPLAFVAVTSAHGPMVTPVLCTARDERLWMVVPRSSAKASAIGRDGHVGVTLVTDDAAAVFQGEGRVVDPLDPRSVLAALPEAVRSPLAVASYLRDHLADLVDLIGPDAVKPRVLVAVRPERYLVVDRASSGRALLGCETPSGPIALPASWDPATKTATVDASLVAATEARTDGPVCVALDAEEPGTKAGMALRGDASSRSSVAEGATVELVVDTDRITWWNGTTTETVKR
jgi:hypothetical protein